MSLGKVEVEVEVQVEALLRATRRSFVPLGSMWIDGAPETDELFVYLARHLDEWCVLGTHEFQFARCFQRCPAFDR